MVNVQCQFADKNLTYPTNTHNNIHTQQQRTYIQMRCSPYSPRFMRSVCCMCAPLTINNSNYICASSRPLHARVHICRYAAVRESKRIVPGKCSGVTAQHRDTACKCVTRKPAEPLQPPPRQTCDLCVYLRLREHVISNIDYSTIICCAYSAVDEGRPRRGMAVNTHQRSQERAHLTHSL